MKIPPISRSTGGFDLFSQLDYKPRWHFTIKLRLQRFNRHKNMKKGFSLDLFSLSVWVKSRCHRGLNWAVRFMCFTTYANVIGQRPVQMLQLYSHIEEQPKRVDGSSSRYWAHMLSFPGLSPEFWSKARGLEQCLALLLQELWKTNLRPSLFGLLSN